MGTVSKMGTSIKHTKNETSENKQYVAFEQSLKRVLEVSPQELREKISEAKKSKRKPSALASNAPVK
jgi:hypothetical protein